MFTLPNYTQWSDS